jgi:hypothetical protein
MLARVPMIPAASSAAVKEGLKPYFAAGATRVIVPYVPSTPQPIEETLAFVRNW